MELINRLEVMDLFETWYCSKCTSKPAICRACWVDDAIDVIEEATEYFVGDVSPRVHAHWITNKHAVLDFCSNCGEAVTRYITAEQMDKSNYEGATYWNYCPHCGAIMGEEEEG